VFDRYHAKDSEERAFTPEQSRFLTKCLGEFRERIALADEAKTVLTPEVLKYIADKIKTPPHQAAQALQEHLETLAIEDPEALSRVLAKKRELDEKEKRAKSSRYDTTVQSALNRNPHDDENTDQSGDDDMHRFHTATAFANQRHEQTDLDPSQRDRLQEEIESRERDIMGVIRPLMMGKIGYPAIAQVGTQMIANETKDQAKLWAGMLRGIAGQLLKVSDSHSKTKAGAEKKKEEKEKEGEDTLSEEEKNYGSSEEVYQNLPRFIKEHRAESLLKWYLVDNSIVATPDSKKVYDKVSSIMKKKEKGWKEKMNTLLKEHWGIEDEEEEEDEGETDGKTKH